MNRGRERRGTTSGPPPPQRDQAESAFAVILSDLVARVPGARSAALVDRDGETVDYAGRANPFETKIAAAHWRIVFGDVREQASLRAAHSLVVRARRASFILHALPEGYALVLCLVRGAGFRGWMRAVPACASSLGVEAGWDAGPSPAWFAVTVASDARERPRALDSGGILHPIEVLGRYTADRPSWERAWRVRLDSGAEATLVCESKRFWYLDEPPDRPATVPPPKNI